MEPFIGQIMMFAGNFEPRGWAFCNGQLLPISQNTALFSILGTTYGGNGQTTFALPDLRGRLPMHWGSGPGLTPRQIGEVGGSESVTLTVNQMPAHTHTLNAVNDDAKASTVDGNLLGNAQTQVYSSEAPSARMAATAIASTGGGQPVPVESPFLCITFIIALEGVFPSRS
jgi:microcystin-dependent protein